MTRNEAKPTTYQCNLVKLPRALAPLIQRRQWGIWRWTQKPDGSWQKPPFMATQPDRHASTNDPDTWSDYATALAAVQAGHADGISYILTKNDPFGAVDLDHCRDKLCSIDVWAQNFMDVGRHTYQEVTPSGEGIRIWGFIDGEPLNRKFTLEIDGKQIAAELFRRTNKALTITGYRLNTVERLTNIDQVLDWALVWGERRKATAERAAPINGNRFDSSGCRYSMDEIEQIVREGAPAGANRSDVFHAIVGHYVGCGWQKDRIDGIGARYINEDRLEREITRSAKKFRKPELPLLDSGWTTLPAEPEAPAQEPPPIEDNPELDDAPEPDIEDEDDGLDDGDEEAPQPDPKLPPLRKLGDRAGPPKKWLIKGLLPEVGTGILGGRRGSGKTFAALDLAVSMMTGQPFLNHMVKRQCGVLWFAAEGQDEIELRMRAVLREKCGNITQAPFVWYETVPLLTRNGSAEKLVAMAQQAEAELMRDHELPLGAIIIDTITSCAGYSQRGDENDNALSAAMMGVLQTLAQKLKSFVLAQAHLSDTGIRGGKSKEEITDAIWVCLGDHQFGGGSMTNTRLVIEKNRGGKDGMIFHYALRQVEEPEKDEDGEPITTCVVDWVKGPAADTPMPDDPWSKAKRQDQRTAALRLQRVLMAILAEQGVDLPIPPDGPVVRMVDQKLVRKTFYASTVADGTPKQQRQARHTQFKSALNWAEQNRLIGIGEIGDVTYLWLAQPDFDGDSEG